MGGFAAPPMGAAAAAQAASGGVDCEAVV